MSRVNKGVLWAGVALGCAVGAHLTTKLDWPTSGSVAASEPQSTAMSSTSVVSATVGEGGAGGQMNCQGGAGEGGDAMVDESTNIITIDTIVIEGTDYIDEDEDPMGPNLCPSDPLCMMGDDAT